jgi:lysyl endopeptidase
MQQVANTLNTWFFFDAVACRSSQVPSFVQRFGGATFLYSNLSQDVLFLRLNDEPPAGAFLTGWNANPMEAGSAITVLHHPQGDLKKFSSGNYSGNTTLASPLNASTGYQRVTYGQGTTEGGSSGAGVLTFDGSQYLLRGGLWGGEASCSAPSAPDYFSRFDIAYSNLRAWLQPATGPAFNVTDMWWNAAESGWGLNLTQHASGQVFGVWYTYTTPNRPYWLILSGGQWVNGTVFTGKLYTVSGPHYAQPAFDTTKVITREVGVMTLTFGGDGNTGSFTWSVDGVTGVKLITRQPF